MTSLSTSWCIFSTTTLKVVHVCVSVAFSAGAAQASAWAEFEARCLVPMENVEAPNLRGLVATESEYSKVDGTQTFVDERQAYLLWAGTLPKTGANFCAILNIPDLEIEASADFFRDWGDLMLASGRYIDVTSSVSHAPISLQSTDWREPRIEVEYNWNVVGAEGPSLFVVETDLEG